MDVRGKIAVVTGAGSGIGRASAGIFAAAGMKVALCGRRKQLLEEAAAEITASGGEAIALPLDVTDDKSVDEMVRRVLGTWGAIDILLNNAGSFKHVGPAWEADPETWWNDVAVNLYGSFLCCRAVLPLMIGRDSGVIVNMDGGGGSTGPNIGASSYACSKTALLRLNEQLAGELTRRNARVLVFGMFPGFVRTEMTEGLAANANGAEWQGFAGSMIERGEGYRPEDCGNAILKLLSVAAPELSGRVFFVDTDFDAVANDRKRIAEEELYVLRLRR